MKPCRSGPSTCILFRTVSSGKTAVFDSKAATVEAEMSAAAVLLVLERVLVRVLVPVRALAYPIVVVFAVASDGDGDGGGGAADADADADADDDNDDDTTDGRSENRARSGGRSASYEQKNRPMYGAVPSSAAARPRYAARKRDGIVFAVAAAAAGVCDRPPWDAGGSSPCRSDRTAARRVG